MSELGNISENFRELERQRKERMGICTPDDGSVDHDSDVMSSEYIQAIQTHFDTIASWSKNEKQLLLETIQKLAETQKGLQEQLVLTTRKICMQEKELYLLRQHNNIQDSVLDQIRHIGDQIKKIKGKLLEGSL